MRTVMFALGATSLLSLLFFALQIVLANTEAPEQAEPSFSISEETVSEWPTSPDFTFAFNPLDPFAKVKTGAEQTGFDPNDDYWGLPRTDGFEHVHTYCSGCHTLEVVMQQHASEKRWRYMLNWMNEQQNMPRLPPADEPIVLRYLTRHFGSEPTTVSFQPLSIE